VPNGFSQPGETPGAATVLDAGVVMAACLAGERRAPY